MNLGDYDDVQAVVVALGDEYLREILRQGGSRRVRRAHPERDAEDGQAELPGVVVSGLLS
jgi:hypothetical protein